MMQRFAGNGLLMTAAAAQVCKIDQQRGMATLKDISIRLKSIKNIQKITKSMKMVSAAKYSRAERELKQARPYGEGAKTFYDRAEIEGAKDDKKELYIAMTSDRGLCGGVHSGIARNIRNELNAKATGDDAIICVGDKSRAILQRTHGKKFLFVASEVGRVPPTFLDASRLANEVLTSGFGYTNGKIVYNKFRTVVSYTLSSVPIFGLKSIESSDKLVAYDSLDADIVQDYLEFSLASLLFYTMKESACSEQSSRMSAMDNASKNAGEMIDKLTLTFNRTRQAVITRELIEIISGAAALTD